MDLLERARALAACPLFENLAPAVVVRLAERARAEQLDPGDRRTSEGTVWVVARGAVLVTHGNTAGHGPSAAGHGNAAVAARRLEPGAAIGAIRIVRAATPVVELVADAPSALVGLAADDVRDILEEDPIALGALADRLAALLMS